MSIRAIPSDGAAFTPPMADLTFASSSTGDFTIGAHTGLITTASSGSGIASVTITNKSSVDANINVTVT